MNLRDFSKVNRQRCEARDGFNHDMDSWSPAEWTNAVAGEAGEACNLAKKLIRSRDGVRGNIKPEDKDPAKLRERLAKELADVIIYADLTIQSLGLDTSDVVRETFNAKSRQMNSPHRYQEAGPPGVTVAEDEQRIFASRCGQRDPFNGAACSLYENHDGPHHGTAGKVSR